MKKLLIGGGLVAGIALILSGGGDDAHKSSAVLEPIADISETSAVAPLTSKEAAEPLKAEMEPAIAEESCHPSYSGCLDPDASDYDCAGGSGNGPYYTGAVKVMGPDVFDLDRDNDGWGCE